MPAFLETLNGNTAIVDKTGRITTYFAQKWRDITSRIESSAFAAAGQIVQYSAQAAAIVTAALVASTSSPLYRVSYDVRISQAAGVSSSVTVTIGFTQGGVAQTYVGAALTGNTTTSKQTDSFLIRPDAGTVITIAVAYASVGAPVANYEADFVAEAIG